MLPTTITGNDDAGNTLAYDAGFVDVYLNGVKMVNGSDVTVTSGSSVVFASAIGASGTDTVDIIAFGTFNVAAVSGNAINSGTINNDRFIYSYGLDIFIIRNYFSYLRIFNNFYTFFFH